MEIPAGFPLPSEIFNGGYENNTRTYLRKFVNLTHPQIVMADNQQVSFKSCKMSIQKSSDIKLLVYITAHCSSLYGTGALVCRPTGDPGQSAAVGLPVPTVRASKLPAR